MTLAGAGWVRPAAVSLAFLLTAGACTFGSSTFSVSNAALDASYSCPAGASNAPYDLQGTIDAKNGTSKSVTINTVGAVMTLTAVQGVWLQKIGDKYDAGSVAFTPGSIGAGATGTLKVTIPSACTHGQGATGTNYGEYAVAFTVATSAGTFKLSSKNTHRILA